MRRSLAIAALFAPSLLSIGCGHASYEARLEATQGRIKDEMTIDQVLSGHAEGAFVEQNVFLRPPQGLAVAPQFLPIPLVEGAFDIQASFVPPGSGEQLATGPFQLHVLARRQAEAGAEGQPEPSPVPRGDFKADVLSVLASVYGAEVAEAPTEQVSKTRWPRSDPARSSSFDRIKMTDRNQHLVHVYFTHEESGDAVYDVALIWEFPGGEPPTSNANPVDLTLGTLAVGQRASRAFSGRPEGTGAGADEEGASAIAF